MHSFVILYIYIYDRSGVYQPTCSECKMKYIGQTGRPCKVRFQEHLRDFKYNNKRSEFAQQIIDNKHTIGKMEDIMEVVHVIKVGKNFYKNVVVLTEAYIIKWICRINTKTKMGWLRSKRILNPLTPNDHYRRRTASLTSKFHFIYLFNKYRYWIF